MTTVGAARRLEGGRGGWVEGGGAETWSGDSGGERGHELKRVRLRRSWEDGRVSVMFTEGPPELVRERSSSWEDATSTETSPSPDKGRRHPSLLPPSLSPSPSLSPRTATSKGEETAGRLRVGHGRGRERRGGGRHIKWSDSPPQGVVGGGGEETMLVGGGEEETMQGVGGVPDRPAHALDAAGGWEVEDVEEQVEMLLRGVDEAAAGGFLFLARDRLTLAKATLRLGSTHGEEHEGGTLEDPRRRRLMAKVVEYDARLGCGGVLHSPQLSPHERPTSVHHASRPRYASKEDALAPNAQDWTEARGKSREGGGRRGEAPSSPQGGGIYGEDERVEGNNSWGGEHHMLRLSVADLGEFEGGGVDGSVGVGGEGGWMSPSPLDFKTKGKGDMDPPRLADDERRGLSHVHSLSLQSREGDGRGGAGAGGDEDDIVVALQETLQWRQALDHISRCRFFVCDVGVYVCFFFGIVPD